MNKLIQTLGALTITALALTGCAATSTQTSTAHGDQITIAEVSGSSGSLATSAVNGDDIQHAFVCVTGTYNSHYTAHFFTGFTPAERVQAMKAESANHDECFISVENSETVERSVKASDNTHRVLTADKGWALLIGSPTDKDHAEMVAYQKAASKTFTTYTVTKIEVVKD